MKREYDERIIAAFLNNYRIVDIVRETGLSKSTVYRYKNNPDFQKALHERKTAIVKAAVNRMRSYLLKDIEELQHIIEDQNTTPQVKVYAVQTLMNQLRDWTTTADIMERLQELQKEIDKTR